MKMFLRNDTELVHFHWYGDFANIVIVGFTIV